MTRLDADERLLSLRLYVSVRFSFFAGKTRKNITDANILVLSLQSHHYKFFKAFVDFYISLNYFMVKEILTICLRIINESI